MFDSNSGQSKNVGEIAASGVFVLPKAYLKSLGPNYDQVCERACSYMHVFHLRV